MSGAAMLIYQFWFHEELLCDLGSSQTIQTLWLVIVIWAAARKFMT